MAFLETDRLELHQISLADAPFYVELFNSEGWLNFVGDRNVRTVADAEAYIQKNYLPCYEQNGYGSYTARLKSSGKTIGACGLYKRDNLPHPDIGFAFLPEFTGKGFGYEAASAVFNYAQNELKFDTLLGITVPRNTASIALLEKLGLREKGTFSFDGDPEELLLFST